MEDLASSVLPSQVEADIYQSRLQIVLLSPALLQFLFKTPNFLLGKLLHPDRVLAVMLGVKDSQILAEHREGTFGCFGLTCLDKLKIINMPYRKEISS